MNKYFNTKTQSKAEELLKAAKRSAETKRIQCILFRCFGADSATIARMVGYTPAHVRLVWKWFRKEGWDKLLGEKRGENRGKAHLKLSEEADFLESFKIEAEKGNLVTGRLIHEAHKNLLGRQVNPTVTYRLLSRHGWRKIIPRPEHPKHDPKKMKHFKEAIFPPGYDPYEN